MKNKIIKAINRDIFINVKYITHFEIWDAVEWEESPYNRFIIIVYGEGISGNNYIFTSDSRDSCEKYIYYLSESL